MFGFIARLIGGAVAPLVDKATNFGARLLRKLALLLVAGLCMVVVVVALTIAFDLWIASLAGPIVGALAVAGFYLFIAMTAAALALRGDTKPVQTTPQADAEGAAQQAQASAKDERVDQFAAPLLAMLASLGLRREQIAVLAGAGLAKRLGPVPLVGIAIVAGFLVGRLWQGWAALLTSDIVETMFDLVVPSRRAAMPEGAEETT